MPSQHPSPACARCGASFAEEAPEGSVCEECAQLIGQENVATVEVEVPDSWQTGSPAVTTQRNEVIGDYEISGKLGQGGMGAVYRARQISLDRVVALKLLPADLEEDETYVARFQREAAVAAGLNHPNVVHVYASGIADGSHFIAMELVEGENLRQRFKRGKLPMPEALRICLEVARGLHFAWQRAQLIHRDIKPSNIYLSTTGEVKVGDLGLAKSLLSNSTGVTHTGTALGTPHYMSPEQARGERAIDLRADIYSLGCTLYQLLTGATPYHGTDPAAVINLHINAPPPAIMKVLPQCPVSVGRLVNKMLRKAKHERHQTYEELIAAMEQALAQLDRGPAGPSAVVAAWREIGDAEHRERVAHNPPLTHSDKPSSSRLPASRMAKPGLWMALAAVVLVLGAGAFSLMKPGRPLAPVSEAPNSGAQLKTAPAQPASRQSGSAAVEPGAPLSISSYPQPPTWADATAAFRSENLASGDLVAEGDWVRATKRLTHSLPGVRSIRNPIVRVLFSDYIGLGVRRMFKDGQDLRYGGYIYQGHAGISLTGASQSKLTVRDLDSPDRLTGEHEAVFAAQGDALNLWLDGKLVATARDSTLPAGSISIALEDGGPLKNGGRIKKVEYGELPDPAPAATASIPSTATWEDLLHGGGRLRKTGEVTQTSDGLRISASGNVYAGRSKQRDGAIRMQTTYGDMRPQVAARRNDNGLYQLYVRAADEVILACWKTVTGKATNLRVFSLSQPLQPGQDYQLELRVVGETLTATMNGQVLGTVNDQTFTEGQFSSGLVSSASSPAEVKKLEFLDLDSALGTPTAAARSTPATATKDAPFTNSLGMRFVPVPITGGPTDKQRVLFSVWETRVQDYLTFSKEAGRPAPLRASWNQEPLQPMTSATWEEVVAFCEWLTQRERKAGRLGSTESYRLPTDHEWSCAAGIGDREDAMLLPKEKSAKLADVYPWGSAWPPPAGSANLGGEELREEVESRRKPHLTAYLSGYSDAFSHVAPVGSFQPNPWVYTISPGMSPSTARMR